MFIYPDNLKAKATLWLWELQDVAIIGVGFLFSVLAIAQTGILLPLVITVLYAFLSIRLEGASILDFLRYAVCYSADGRSGYLTKAGIAQIKSDLAQEVFRQDLTELYRQQTQRRDVLNRDAQAVMRELIHRMEEGGG